MRYLHTKLILILVTFSMIQLNAQSQKNIDWKPFEFLIGSWTGEGGGKPGEGKGNFSFDFDLDKNVLIRKNHNEIPASEKSPASIHNDLLIVYPDGNDSFKAIYFDNENHIINYCVKSNPESLIFESEKNNSTPRFRLTYTKLSPEKVNILFEIAMPNNPDNYFKYLEGSAVKQK